MKAPYRPGMTKSGYRGYGWFVIPQWNITIAAPPKAGSSSLKQFMWMNEIECSYVPHNQVRGDVYFVVRDPIERFCSLWRSKCRDGENISHNVKGMSPTELMRYIESGATDVHWTSQSQLIGNLNATLIPLEYLNIWWTARGYGNIGTFNPTIGAVEIADLQPRINNFYCKDKELYEKSLLTFDPNHV